MVIFATISARFPAPLKAVSAMVGTGIGMIGVCSMSAPVSARGFTNPQRHQHRLSSCDMAAEVMSAEAAHDNQPVI